jgi:hypothetical protein
MSGLRLEPQVKAVFTSAGGVEGGEAVAVGALDTSADPLLAKVADLRRLLVSRARNMDRCPLTSFQRFFGIRSTPSTGSMYMVLATPVSGTHIAHNKWAQDPVVVCLKAPNSAGQRTQVLRGCNQHGSQLPRESLHTTGLSGDTVHLRQSHWPSGIYGTP